MSISSASQKVARVASIASFALLMSTGIVSTAQADPAQPESEVQACSSAGGGTWCRGSALGSAPWYKVCYSNYVHPNNYHSSTASMAGGVDKRYANAGAWSRASVEAGAAHTCYAYYDPNA